MGSFHPKKIDLKTGAALNLLVVKTAAAVEGRDLLVFKITPRSRLPFFLTPDAV